MKCFDDFLQVVSELRRGCPWDRAQTLLSLEPCLLNETAETVAGIHIYEKTQDAENLCEELGDLLFLILLQSEIAGEEGLFTLEDVIEGISRKMIRRHLHVFGKGFTDENGELIRGWKEIKKLEKAGKTAEELAMQKREVETAEREIARFFAESGTI